MVMTAIQFKDALFLDGLKRTRDGYLAASAKVARTGIQLYDGASVGRPDMPVVRVYRPEEEVFSKDAIKSYAHRPVTLGHPSVQVDASNWKEYSVGQTGEDVVRDGEVVRVPMVLMDAAAIKAVDSGVRELSMGYTAEIDFVDGVTPSGEPYDAIQKNMRMNHLAVVAEARGGSALKIGDSKTKGDSAMTEFTKMVLDGITVNVPVSDAANVKALFDAKDTKLADANKSLDAVRQELADAKKSVDTLTGEKAALEKQIKDGELTPERLNGMVAERSALLSDAKRILGDSADIDALGSDDIKRKVVENYLGDAAKDMSADAIAGAYTVAVKAGGSSDPVRGVVKDGVVTSTVAVSDALKARKEAMAERAGAYKGGAK